MPSTRQVNRTGSQSGKVAEQRVRHLGLISFAKNAAARRGVPFPISNRRSSRRNCTTSDLGGDSGQGWVTASGDVRDVRFELGREPLWQGNIFPARVMPGRMR